MEIGHLLGTPLQPGPLAITHAEFELVGVPTRRASPTWRDARSKTLFESSSRDRVLSPRLARQDRVRFRIQLQRNAVEGPMPRVAVAQFVQRIPHGGLDLGMERIVVRGHAVVSAIHFLPRTAIAFQQSGSP